VRPSILLPDRNCPDEHLGFRSRAALIPAYGQRGRSVIPRRAYLGDREGVLWEEIHLSRTDNRAGAILRVEFCINVLDVLLHRTDADDKLVSDFAIGQPVCDEGEHIQFAKR
jgi:hypothetical protein